MFRVSEINEIQLRRVSTHSSVALITLLLFGVSLLGFAPTAHAQSEDQVIAAFLLNFARYVEWPKDAFETPDSPVSICVVGRKQERPQDQFAFTSLGEGREIGIVMVRTNAEMNSTSNRDTRGICR